MKKLLNNICLSTAVLFTVTHISIQAAAGSSYEQQREPSAIHAWAKSGNIEKLKQARQQFLDQNLYITNTQGNTPLALAAGFGHLEVVKFLLNAYRNYQEKFLTQRYGATGEPSSSSELQTPLDQQNDAGYTPLALAAMYGHPEVVATLLQEGSDPTIPNNDIKGDLEYFAEGENTPLHWVAKRLIDPKYKDKHEKFYQIGMQIITKTPMQTCEKIYPYIKKRSDEYSDDKKTVFCQYDLSTQRNGANANLFHTLAGQHRLKIPKAPTEEEKGTFTPVMLPSDYQKEHNLPQESTYSITLLTYLMNDVVKKFEKYPQRKRAPAFKWRDKQRMTPLHWAAMSGFAQTARILIQNGAEIDEIRKQQDKTAVPVVNSKDSQGKTPLHWAALRGHKDVIEELLQADDAPLTINEKDERGRTPLHWVVRQTDGSVGYGRGYHLPVGHAVEIMKLLIEHGADPMIEDAEGHNVFYWLGENEKTRGYVEDLFTLYSKASATGKPKTSHAAPSSAAASSSWAQAQQAAPMAQPPTVHSGAASQEIIEKLKKAIDEANITQAALLTNQNPGLATAKDSKGMQPLYYLATKPIDDKSRIRAGIAALLIMRGAHNDAATYEYMSPLAIAATKNNSTLVDMLLKKDDAHITTDELIAFRGFTTDEQVKELLGDAYAARLRKAALNNDTKTFKHLLKLAQEQKITTDNDIATHLGNLLMEIHQKTLDGTIDEKIADLLRTEI